RPVRTSRWPVAHRPTYRRAGVDAGRARATAVGDPARARRSARPTRPRRRGVRVNDFGALDGTAIVTGGSGGLGAAVCRLLAERGSDVAVFYRSNAEAAGAVERDIVAQGRRAVTVSVDLLDASATASAVDEVAGQFGGVHTLVHAAGPLVHQLHVSKVDPVQF